MPQLRTEIFPQDSIQLVSSIQNDDEDDLNSGLEGGVSIHKLKRALENVSDASSLLRVVTKANIGFTGMPPDLMWKSLKETPKSESSALPDDKITFVDEQHVTIKNKYTFTQQSDLQPAMQKPL